MTKSRARTVVILVVLFIVGVIVINLLSAGLDRAVEGNQPGGVTDSSYATGGDTFTPSQFGLSTVNHIDAGTAVASATTGYSVMPDFVNNKLKLIGGAASGVAGAEVTAATDTHLVVARVLAIGDSPYV